MGGPFQYNAVLAFPGSGNGCHDPSRGAADDDKIVVRLSVVRTGCGLICRTGDGPFCRAGGRVRMPGGNGLQACKARGCAEGCSGYDR